jgi:hypothetical protein
MRRTVLALLPTALMLAASPALAQGCDPYNHLMREGRQPEMFIVKPGTERLHFRDDFGEDEAAYVVPGNLVIVTAQQQNNDLCASYTSQTFTMTSGWLPKDALEPVTPKPDRSSWIGDWRLGDEQEIRIGAAGRDRLTIEGYASFGGDDPERAENGGVHTGTIEGRLQMQSEGRITFSPDDDGQPIAAASLADTDRCVVTLWQMPPYLIVADNLMCGGQNVTFTGIYVKAVAE